MVRVKNKFDDWSWKVHIPGNSISSSILNDSLDMFKSLKNAQTLEDEISSHTRNLLISAPYRENIVELSESSLSPPQGSKQSMQLLKNKSPLYSLNNQKTRKDHNNLIFSWKYKTHIERSSSAQAVTEREIHYLQEANHNLMTDNDSLTQEVRELKMANRRLRESMEDLGGVCPRKMVERYQALGF